MRADRRQALRRLAGASLVPFFTVGCSDDTTSGTVPDGGATSEGGTGGGGTSSCSTIPEETAGPFPGDGSNGANALTLSGIVRSDIRSSIDTASGVAAGIPLAIKLALVDTSAVCAPLAGYAVYVWHCDRDGNYSMYSTPVRAENYLRGVQETAADGTVTFTSIFPACYSGRMPHIHFEVYPSLAAAADARNTTKTSQLALPPEICNEVYATPGYSQSVINLSRISFATDSVFSDGVTLQLATVVGNVTEGYVATLTVGIAT